MGNINSCENKFDNKESCKNVRDIKIKKALDEYDMCVAKTTVHDVRRHEPKNSLTNQVSTIADQVSSLFGMNERPRTRARPPTRARTVSYVVKPKVNKYDLDTSDELEIEGKKVILDIDTDIAKPDVINDDVLSKLNRLLDSKPAAPVAVADNFSATSSAMPSSEDLKPKSMNELSDTSSAAPFFTQEEIKDLKKTEDMKGGGHRKKMSKHPDPKKKNKKSKKTKKYKGKKGGAWSEDSSTSSTSSISSDSDSDFGSSSDSSDHKKNRKNKSIEIKLPHNSFRRHEGQRHEGQRHEGRHEGQRHEGQRHEGQRHEGRHDGQKREHHQEKKVDYESSTAHTGGEFSESNYKNNRYQETSVNTSDINMISEY